MALDALRPVKLRNSNQTTSQIKTETLSPLTIDEPKFIRMIRCLPAECFTTDFQQGLNYQFIGRETGVAWPELDDHLHIEKKSDGSEVAV